MKKLISLVVVAAMVMAMFAGCGSKAEPAAEAKSEAAAPAAEAASSAAEAASSAAEAASEAAPAADGEHYTIMVANHDASTSMCELYIETLCNMMAEESGGRLEFIFNPGGSLLGSTETIDGVKDGAAEMCWSTTAFFSGRFPVTEFLNLAGNGVTSARMATDVFQQMYEEMPEVQAEYSDWKVIALHTCGIAPISTIKKKIETLDDLKGLQIRAAGTVQTQYLDALGANAISMPTPDVYEALEKGVIDGMGNDYHNIDCFKLYEPIDYCLNFGLNVSACFVLMNKDVYESMDDECKAIIDKYAGNYAGDMAGYWWDSCNYWVQDEMKANGVEVSEPSDEFVAAATSEDIIGPLHQWYIQYLNDAGLDGQAIYDKCMDIVAQNKDAHADDWAAPFSYTDWTFTPDDYQ